MEYYLALCNAISTKHHQADGCANQCRSIIEMVLQLFKPLAGIPPFPHPSSMIPKYIYHTLYTFISFDMTFWQCYYISTGTIYDEYLTSIYLKILLIFLFWNSSRDKQNTIKKMCLPVFFLIFYPPDTSVAYAMSS